MAEFDRIQAIQTLVSDCETHRKAMVQLRVAGTTETLTITCPSLEVAESLADLIDGYCRLVTQSTTSLWNRKGEISVFKYFLSEVIVLYFYRHYTITSHNNLLCF
jgi:focal adhesion kinase 1